MELEALLRHEEVTIDRRDKLDDAIKAMATTTWACLCRDVTATFRLMLSDARNGRLNSHRTNKPKVG